MMEVRLILNDDMVKGMMEKPGCQRQPTSPKMPSQCSNGRFEEAAKGRVVLSSDSTGGDIHRLAMPSLNRAQKLASSS